MAVAGNKKRAAPVLELPVFISISNIDPAYIFFFHSAIDSAFMRG